MTVEEIAKEFIRELKVANFQDYAVADSPHAEELKLTYTAFESFLTQVIKMEHDRCAKIVESFIDPLEGDGSDFVKQIAKAIMEEK